MKFPEKYVRLRFHQTHKLRDGGLAGYWTNCGSFLWRERGWRPSNSKGILRCPECFQNHD